MSPTLGDEPLTMIRSEDLLRHIVTDFLGLNTTYPVATGETICHIYLDSIGSTPMMGDALKGIIQRKDVYLSHYRLADSHHEYRHTSFTLDTDERFSVARLVDQALAIPPLSPLGSGDLPVE